MKTPGNVSGMFMLVAAMVVAASEATAQAPAQSFADLQRLITEGQNVVVWGTDGRKTRGQAVLVSGDTLEIRRPPRFGFGADRRQVFMEASVNRVDDRDSTTVYGGLLGFVVGIAVSVTVAKTATCEDLCDLPVVALAPFVGSFVGAAIDGAINRPLYTSPATNRVTLAPLWSISF